MATIWLYPSETNPRDIKLSDPTVQRSGGAGTILLASTIALLFTSATGPIQAMPSMAPITVSPGGEPLYTSDATGLAEFDLSVQLASSKPLPFAVSARFNTSGAVSETLTATASQTGLAVFSATRSESLTPTDSQVGGLAHAGAVTEAVTVGESQTALASFAGNRTETLTAVETQTGPALFTGARTEALTAVDAQTGLALFVTAQSESLSPADTQAATAVFSGAITETLTATDSSTGTIPAPGETAGAFTWRFQGGPLMSASISGGSVLTARLTGGPV